MNRSSSMAVIGALAWAILSAACATSQGAQAVEYQDLADPVIVASDDAADLAEEWDDLLARAVDLGHLGVDAQTIQDFEPFNGPWIALTDGRVLVRGRWQNDDPIDGWYRRNPASVAAGQVNPVIETSHRPVRLFVYDPSGGQLQPVSHVPEVYSFSTAITVGASPDAVLDVVVLAGEQAVAYRSGFSGAAYDIVREIYVAPIPR